MNVQQIWDKITEGEEKLIAALKAVEDLTSKIAALEQEFKAFTAVKATSPTPPTA